MSVASMKVGGDFRVGDVLSRAWQIFSGNLLFFLGITFLFYIAFIAVIFVFALLTGAAFGLGGGVGLAYIWLLLASVLGLGLYMVGQGVLLFGAFQRLRGQAIQVDEAFRRVMPRFFPLTGLAILVFSALFIAAAVGVLLVWGVSSAIGWLASLVLLPLPVVAALMLVVIWAVVVPACIVESLGPIASMGRSADLTKGYRWKIFGIIILLVVLSVVCNHLIQFIVAQVSTTLAAIAALVLSACWAAYWNCAIIMIYHDLRVAKEGVDTEQIASIFD